MVKKKKSRLGLDGMKWGTLGEVTNVPSSSQVGTKEEKKREKEREKKEKEQEREKTSENLLKVKGEDSVKWWSIRGRKDSKDKSKENKSKPPPRSKSRCSD